ncbi:MAG: peptide-methionine (S)-S-oxide reductase MsrA [Elusimicrobiaceae bacterium]|nr:peptide-methionine (S)-S-oxide reductase MsrA [Elusimicrobiaceae bacterium]
MPNFSKQAVFAGGCFWGVEHLMQTARGVLDVQSGYTGGELENPSYEQVKTGTTGHLEAVCVTYDPAHINYETLAKLFFEIHDPTQTDGQGPDIGSQYHSAVFYADDEQKQIAEKLIKILKQKGYKIATKVLPLQTFWPAEEYHQDYYARKGTQPYCHMRVKRFD